MGTLKTSKKTQRASEPLTVTSEGAEPHPLGWHDELVAHTIRRNEDGSITAICLINLYDDQKNCYSAERVIRLEKRGRS